MKRSLTRWTWTLRLVCFALLLGRPALSAAQQPFRLTLLHTNDTHSHHEPQSDGNGGVARQAALVKKIRAEVPNTLLVDAGDRFTGTLFHKYWLGQDNARVMNALGYQAMTPGNHEFDNGPEVLAKFLDALKFPVVSTNIDAAKSKELAGKFKPSLVLEVGGEKIGILGLTTAETPEITIAYPGKENVVFNPNYAEVVNAEVTRLESQGINKIILLTHIGYGLDVQLAAKVSGVDVIVGGHSHTLLSNTAPTAAIRYPTALKSASGEPIYVVQAGERTLYLGRLDLEFDAKGIVTKASGDTILLGKDLPADDDMQALLAELGKPIGTLQTATIKTARGEDATAAGTFDSQPCRIFECTPGNLIADAMRAETGAQIALMNGGGIRANLDAGPITVGEVVTVVPFGNTLATLKLTGADLLAALENGVSQVGASSGTGRFPQVSGLRFSYNPNGQPGKRIVGVDVLGADGNFTRLDPAATYSVVTNDFMRTGGDGYTVLKDKAINPYDFGRPLDQVLMDYIAAHSPVTPKLDGRIAARPG